MNNQLYLNEFSQKGIFCAHHFLSFIGQFLVCAAIHRSSTSECACRGLLYITFSTICPSPTQVILWAVCVLSGCFHLFYTRLALRVFLLYSFHECATRSTPKYPSGPSGSPTLSCWVPRISSRFNPWDHCRCAYW